MIITIDGPMASGKSTVARLVAQRLRYYYIASGLLYRAVAHELSQKYGYTRATINMPAESHVLDVLSRLIYTYNDGKEAVCIDGVDRTEQLKSSAVDALASILSTNKEVRESINEYLRELAKQHSIVIDGRDCGSVIFTHAEHKFYVTATVEVRALRWQKLQASLGTVYTIDQCIECVKERDERDMSRAYAPLIVPVGAQIIDSSTLSVPHVVDHIIEKIKRQHTLQYAANL